MSSSWDEFKRKNAETVHSLKPRLNITIYGSYQPQKDYELLMAIKQHLIENKYSNTALVTDFDDGTMDALALSEACLKYSDVNFIIFTGTGMGKGATRELAYAATSQDMIDKVSGCVVFDEIVEDRSSLSELSLIDIRNSGIRRREFRTIERLKEAIVWEAFWQLRRLSPRLVRRPESGA